jgi:hypothetical protein
MMLTASCSAPARRCARHAVDLGEEQRRERMAVHACATVADQPRFLGPRDDVVVDALGDRSVRPAAGDVAVGEEREADERRDAEVALIACVVRGDRFEHEVVVHLLVADDAAPVPGLGLVCGEPLQSAVCGGFDRRPARIGWGCDLPIVRRVLARSGPGDRLFVARPPHRDGWAATGTRVLGRDGAIVRRCPRRTRSSERRGQNRDQERRRGEQQHGRRRGHAASLRRVDQRAHRGRANGSSADAGRAVLRGAASGARGRASGLGVSRSGVAEAGANGLAAGTRRGTRSAASGARGRGPTRPQTSPDSDASH